MGTPAIAVPTLATLADIEHVVGVATQPDRRAGRGRLPVMSPVKAWAADHGVAVEQPATLRDSAASEAIRAYLPDVIVVFAYGLILPPAILQLPRHGCVNVHVSLLPRHRGATPIQGAILAGDVVTGVTTMLMDEGLDTGPILLQTEVAVGVDDTVASLGDRLAGVGASLASRTVRGLADGRLDPLPQDESAATVTRLLRKSDGRIEWDRSAQHIHRHVRAMNPWPAAFSELRGTRLQVWRAEIGPPSALQPGEIEVRADALLVGCGDGESLQLLELQRAGGRRLPPMEFVRGFAVVPGERFGEAPSS